MDRFRVRFRWVFPPGQSPIEDAIVTFEDGHVSDVTTSHTADIDCSVNAALIAGVVNAHTHLEFSDLEIPLTPAEPFTGWIRALLQHRRTRTMPTAEIIAAGLKEVSRSGTTLVGEINTTGDLPVYRDAPSRSVVFRELLGLTASSIADQLEIARAHVAHPTDNSTCINALSPHAPYSVHPDLLRDIVQVARDVSRPVAMHVAETLAERELLSDGTGEFRVMLEEFGLFSAELFGGRRPLDELRQLSHADRGLIIHGNYLDADEINFLSDCEHMTVVYCPRTHSFFGHESHPWQTFIANGVRVALGTDSRASNPDLNVWEEAKFLYRQHPEASPASILEMVTVAGEAGLVGSNQTTPEITNRRTDQLSLVHLPERVGRDPYASLFHSEGRCGSLDEVMQSRTQDRT